MHSLYQTAPNQGISTCCKISKHRKIITMLQISRLIHTFPQKFWKGGKAQWAAVFRERFHFLSLLLTSMESLPLTFLLYRNASWYLPCLCLFPSSQSKTCLCRTQTSCWCQNSNNRTQSLLKQTEKELRQIKTNSRASPTTSGWLNLLGTILRRFSWHSIEIFVCCFCLWTWFCAFILFEYWAQPFTFY